MDTTTTLNAAEIAKFSALADGWWDEQGDFAPLHRINPIRLGYLREQALQHFDGAPQSLTALQGLTALDIGCGGGLVAEPIARMGAEVTAIDGSERNIAIAQNHAERSHLSINYQCTTAEALAESNAQFDMVLALEVVEHVDNVALFLRSINQLLKPGGLLVMSTLNRTLKSYALAIVGAEYVLRWLPRGTHDWQKFLKPHELIQPLQAEGLQHQDSQGMVMHPLSQQWRMTPDDLSVNYYVSFVKPL